MIDVEFLKGLEGFETKGYVPHARGSKSGVTVGSGVDLGHTDVHRLDIPDDLKRRLDIYRGKIGKEAVKFLRQHPLELTEYEALLLSQQVLLRAVVFVKNQWNADSDVQWMAIPDALQTVVFSVLYQYGSRLRVPKFWKAATSLDIKATIAELRDFGDSYPTRRNKEADYLENHILERYNELVG